MLAVAIIINNELFIDMSAKLLRKT